MLAVIVIDSLTSGYNAFRMKDGDCEVSEAYVSSNITQFSHFRIQYVQNEGQRL